MQITRIITYQKEKNLSADEFISILQRSTLAERRPVNEPERIVDMLKHANLVVTARQSGLLVGVARALTDFAFCTYLSDLAVDQDFQSKGVGKELIRQVMLATGKAKLILLAAPAAVDYYPKIGMNRHEHCFILESVNDLK